MDYLKIYKEQYNYTWEAIKNNTLEALKLAKSNKSNFDTEFKNVLKGLNESQTKIIEEFKKTGLYSCYEIFEKRYSLIDNDLAFDEIISFVLSNQIKNEFIKQQNLDYELFIKKLAEQQSIDLTENHFRNYIQYYEFIYATGKLEYFYAKNFDRIGYQSSEEFKDMLKIRYPESTQNGGAILNVIEQDSDENSVSNKNKAPFDVVNTKDRIKNEFNIKERAILLHLLKNRLNLKEIVSTELIKLVLIIGSTDKFEIFNKEAHKSYLYKQVHKGYSVFKETEAKDKITSLKVKLENNGLKSIADELQFGFGSYFNNKK
ncbi:hypothetical protein F6U93_09985 [Tamlana haliotis]|uniref:Uncharacterized protein n=1 Tax=Pseudotamlana haliotis TaxID=2614804 RepID=A0A6N6MAN8_9FLAO|nr:hypothetical protein [Tamlana haliotis]KAB1067605.1 hypothetical protein F6U93_09985 [Tamlana haliotis]